MVEHDGPLQAGPEPCHLHPALIPDPSQRTTMMSAKKLLAILALLPGFAFASEEGFKLDRAPEPSDISSLQNRAKLFVNHCLNCHSASAMRYNRLRDLGLSEDQIKNNLLFSGEKVGDLMNVALRPADAKAWFGTVPPDLP